MLDVLGIRIRELRKARGWSQRELGARAGLSVRFLVQLEGGTGNASVLRLADVARALGLSMVSLFSGLGPVEDPEHQIMVGWRDMSAGGREQVMALLGVSSGQKVSLVGLRGAGKSTVGQAVCAKLGWCFVELDDRIREIAGMGLKDLFEYHGMERYRELRLQVLEQVLSEQGDVMIEVGGSVVLDETAYGLLKERTETIWLRATPYDHLQRVKEQGDTRPMAGRINPLGELRAILQTREPLYAQADHCVETSQLSLQGVVDVVLAKVSQELDATRL
jgi:XRE family aerobic/anaerobic benzoate catabolism transcriptional regulator